MHSIYNLFLNLSQDLLFNIQMHNFNLLCDSLRSKDYPIFDQFLHIYLFDEERHLYYLLDYSLDVLVYIYYIGFNLLYNFDFTWNLDYFGIFIELVNLCDLLHHSHNLLQHKRHFLYLLYNVLHLNNLLLYNSNLFILRLHNYLFPINYLHLVLNIWDFMNHIHLLNPDNFLNLWYDHIISLRLWHKTDSLVNDGNGQLFFQNNWDWYFHRMYNNIISLDHFYVIHIQVLNPISEDFYWFFFGLYNYTLVDYLMWNLDCSGFDVFYKDLLYNYLLFLDRQVNDSFHWNLYWNFSDARYLDYFFNRRHFFRYLHDFLNYFFNVLRYQNNLLNNSRHNNNLLHNSLNLNTLRHLHNLLNNLLNSLYLSLDAVIIERNRHCLFLLHYNWYLFLYEMRVCTMNFNRHLLAYYVGL